MIFVKYVSFAVFASFVNLFSQWLIFKFFFNDYILIFAISIGTFLGLITKYYLDKNWIFEYSNQSYGDEFNKFSLYTMTGIFTTCIFWIFEVFFYYFINISNSHLWGGALGLSFGYSLKYFLDKKIVFTRI
jgi:putative flippase GtrA